MIINGYIIFNRQTGMYEFIQVAELVDETQSKAPIHYSAAVKDGKIIRLNLGTLSTSFRAVQKAAIERCLATALESDPATTTE